MDQSLVRARRDTASRLFALMLGVFLGGGLLASVEALLVPRLKLLPGIGYAQALLVQLVYYAGYLLFAWPATMLTARVGAMRAIAAGLGAMAAGCLAFAGAAASLRFGAMLAALLLTSSGVTVLQIACNGLMATLGGRAEAAARFTLLQGFNALGTVAGPLAAAWFLLGADRSGAPAPFLAFAIGFGALALAFAAHRDLLPAVAAARPSAARLRALAGDRRLRRGACAIFAYVGAEVTIGTLGVNYLILPRHGGLAPVAAGRLISLYWTGAMLGRFAGAWLLGRVPAARLLGWTSLTALALVGAAAALAGIAGGAALLAVGLCNSIMFPTIYGLAMPDRPEDMASAAMLLCMAVVGGAIVPMLTGLVADRTSLEAGLALPAACYAGICLFARAARTVSA